jgi:hypothetical protein
MATAVAAESAAGEFWRAAARRRGSQPRNVAGSQRNASQNGARSASGCYRSKPFVQPIKTRESGARPVLGYSEVYCVAVARPGHAIAGEASAPGGRPGSLRLINRVAGSFGHFRHSAWYTCY